MQDPNADTEWNDVLRAKGIIPPREGEKEVTEEDIVNMVEKTIEEKSKGRCYGDMTLDELNDAEDDISDDDERAFEEYRRQRLAELMANQRKARFGDVREISKDEYVAEVNKAGDGVWVVLLVYKPSIPLCKQLEEHFITLARKFPATKFLKSVSSVCIPNYPDRNLPTLFVYHEGELKVQHVGPAEFGGGSRRYTVEELEWKISRSGAIKTDLESDPRQGVDDVMMSELRGAGRGEDLDNDW